MELQIQNIQQIDHASTDFQARKQVNHDEPEEFKLTIHLSEYYRYITDIWIFDINLNLIISPENESEYLSVREYKLPSLKYIIRIGNNGQICDNEINLNKDLVVSVGEKNTAVKKMQLPLLYSSAPISGPIEYASSDPAYVDAAEQISRERISLQDTSSRNNGIFFFFRYPTVSLYRENYYRRTYWQRFELLNENGEVILRFPEHCTVSYHHGYLGVSLALKKGNYYLQYKKTGQSRMVPIYVYDNWYTQFFMTLANEPLFGSIRYFLNRNSNFDSTNIYNSYVDICLDKLQNNDFKIDPNLLWNISNGKFESPMLGLIGAFLYFSSKESKDDNLFILILENLQNRILHDVGDSPDIMALKFLAKEHFGVHLKIDKSPVYSRTPILRIAFDTIRRNAYKNPWLIEERSIDDFIIEKQIFDSPFNTFKPLRKATLKRTSKQDQIINDAIALNKNKYISGSGDDYFLRSANRPLRLEQEDVRLISEIELKEESALKQMTMEGAFKRHGAAGAAIFEKLTETSNRSTIEIAQTLNLPEVTVERIRRGFKL